MTLSDFNIYDIHYFTPGEIEATGAKLENVQLTTILKLNVVRHELQRRIHLLHNGLTTGKHSAEEHPKGLAVDWHLDLRDGPIDFALVKRVVYDSLYAGFRGIGAYWNGEAYSFHTDCRHNYGMWYGLKDDNNEWEYGDLLVDPKR